MELIKLAAFGFRSFPPTAGAAGADKFVYELLPRLANRGYIITAYNRLYPNQRPISNDNENINIVNLKTVNKSGFDTLLHSFKTTLHIVFKNNVKIVHIQNGGNSIWAIPLRLFGKKVFISQDGLDWKRNKWPWYAKIYLRLSIWFTTYIPNGVICDNIFIRDYLIKKYPRQRKRFYFVPFGSDVRIQNDNDKILKKLSLEKEKYLLFVGRFIPDKGVHYLINAYKMLNIYYKLVLVGGSPNPTEYERSILDYENNNIIFPGYIYGDDVNVLIKYCYLYIQPSDAEGLSPVILQVMGLGTPILCSDIKENLFIVKNDATTFKKSNIEDLTQKIQYCVNNSKKIKKLAVNGKLRILREYSWDKVTEEHIKIFNK